MRAGTATAEQLEVYAFLDAVAFSLVRGLIGLDEVQVAISGAAPIPAEILEPALERLAETFQEQSGITVQVETNLDGARLAAEIEMTGRHRGAVPVLAQTPEGIEAVDGDPARLEQARQIERGGFALDAGICREDDLLGFAACNAIQQTFDAQLFRADPAQR